MTITKEKYNDLKARGKSNKEIAEAEGITVQALSYHTKKWKTEGDYQEAKQQVVNKIQEDPGVIKTLQAKNTELEEQVKGYPALVERAEKAELQNLRLQNDMAAALINKNNIAQIAENLKNQIEQLKTETEGLHEQVADWRDKARSYARENELMNGMNKDLRGIAEGLRREAMAARAYIKELA